MSLTSIPRRAARRALRPLRRSLIGARTGRWPPHTRLFVLGDSNQWSIADDAYQLRRIAAALGSTLGPQSWTAGVRNQSLFHTDHFSLLLQPWQRHGNRIGVAYLHGRPGTPGVPEFDTCFENLRACHDRLDRVQVTNRAMREITLASGIAPEKVLLIPIGVDLGRFPQRDRAMRANAREALGLPESSFVVGSFQKDGVGWGEGLQPKLIKGPDVFLEAMELARERVPELMVLLTGPARGFVKAGLERLGIPYRHLELAAPGAVAAAYQALDAYVVSSREEGGPKAVLESMATGVPIVSTAVGQAVDLVARERNGWIVEVGDAAAIAEIVCRVASSPAADLERVVQAGRATAEANSYESLHPRWRELLAGLVALPGEG